jgi:hypothetical protein
VTQIAINCLTFDGGGWGPFTGSNQFRADIWRSPGVLPRVA